MFPSICTFTPLLCTLASCGVVKRFLSSIFGVRGGQPLGANIYSQSLTGLGRPGYETSSQVRPCIKDHVLFHLFA